MNYNSSKNQAIIGKLVEREVIQNVSMLVTELCRNEHYTDELLEVCQTPDYEQAVENDESLIVIYDDDIGFYSWVKKEKGQDDFVSCDFGTRIEAYQDCVEVNELDYDYIEAYEHYLISDWLANKLESKGEMIMIDFCNLTIWGRTCTGQAILLDNVMGEIAEEMEILDGQSNEWKV